MQGHFDLQVYLTAAKRPLSHLGTVLEGGHDQ